MDQKKSSQSKKESTRKILELSSIGLALPSSIAIGLFLGYYLDKLFGTDPWLLIIFLLFGIASGIISLIRGVNKYKNE
jgi:ATP synthase protein I